MSDVKQGMRGTADYSANQRPGSFGKGIKQVGPRVSREDVKKVLMRKQKKREKH